MGRSNKFDYQAIIEGSLIAHPDGLTLDELVERSGLEVDRSTLFRHLAHLIELGRAERVGKARASRYRPLDLARIGADPEPPGTRGPAVRDVPERPERQSPSPESQPPNETPILSPDEARQPHPTDGAKPAGATVVAPEHAAVVEKAVRTIVRQWKRYDRLNLQIYLSLMVKPEHLNGLTAAVEQELAGLHEGNLADFGLTQADFRSFIPPAGREGIGS